MNEQAKNIGAIRMQANNVTPQGAGPAPAVTETVRGGREFSLVRAKPWIIGGALLVIIPALYFGWSWLTAAGAAGVLLALAPCLAMCALGICTRCRRNS